MLFLYIPTHRCFHMYCEERQSLQKNSTGFCFSENGLRNHQCPSSITNSIKWSKELAALPHESHQRLWLTTHGLLIPGSDGWMWSGESEAQKFRYTSDYNAAWLLMGAFLIALKIWQHNASGFRHYGNYPRDATALTVIYWSNISHAGCAIFTYSQKAFRFSHWRELHSHQHRTRVAMNFSRLFSLFIFIAPLSTVVPLHLLFTKKLVTKLAIRP